MSPFSWVKLENYVTIWCQKKEHGKYYPPPPQFPLITRCSHLHPYFFSTTASPEGKQGCDDSSSVHIDWCLCNGSPSRLVSATFTCLRYKRQLCTHKIHRSYKKTHSSTNLCNRSVLLSHLAQGTFILSWHGFFFAKVFFHGRGCYSSDVMITSFHWGSKTLDLISIPYNANHQWNIVLLEVNNMLWCSGVAHPTFKSSIALGSNVSNCTSNMSKDRNLTPIV